MSFLMFLKKLICWQFKAEARAEFAEKSVKKLQKEVDRLEGNLSLSCSLCLHFVHTRNFLKENPKGRIFKQKNHSKLGMIFDSTFFRQFFELSFAHFCVVFFFQVEVF